MPKLPSKLAKKVSDAEPITGGNFEPLKPGKYVGRLREVVAKTTNAGGSMWVAEFDTITSLDGRTSYPGRQWYNLNLPTGKPMPSGYTPRNSAKSPQESWDTFERLSEGRLHAFFDAFGYTPDSDTDELLGERAILSVGVRTIQQGDRKGEKANQVNGVEALTDEVATAIPDDDTDEF